MAIVAFTGSNEVIRRFTRSLSAVVARATRTGYTAVIKARWQPRRCRMADITLGRGLYVCGVLAGGSCAVVTTGAGARGYVGMIKHSGGPAVRSMTVITSIV